MAQHARNTSGGGRPEKLPPPKLVAVDRLNVLRTNLIALIDSLYTFQQQISYGGQESMMSWPDLVAKYSLVLSNTHTISSQLGHPPHAASQTQRDLERNLSRVIVFPGKPVDQSLDYRVGVLLRTKQYPDVEEAQTELLRSLPTVLHPGDADAADSELDQLTTAEAGHDKLVRFALRKLRTVSGIDAPDDDGSEDEDEGDDAMDEDAEPIEYDWKMRLVPAVPPRVALDGPDQLKSLAAVLRDGS